MYQPFEPLPAMGWTGGGAASGPTLLRGEGQVARPAARNAVRSPRADAVPAPVVDLAVDLFSRRWWQGLATLALLSTTAALMAPDLSPLPAGRPAPLPPEQLQQARALAIAPLARGARTGLRMAETAAVAPLSHAPERPTIELFATLSPGDTLAALLSRSGAAYGDAGQAAALIRSAAPPGIAPGTSIAITLGRRSAGGRPIQRLALRAALDLRLELGRTASGLTLTRIPVAVDSTPLRLGGRVGDGLYWSLRAAGVNPTAAQHYLRALGSRLDLGSEIGGDDRFDLVVANRRAETGENVPGPLLYAGLDRAGGGDLQLLKWTIDGRTDWYEASGVGRRSSGMAWPTSGRISSRFGRRVHPILRFVRWHKGVDFAAGWGSPIVAAADGRVIGAGWHGGYGQQVRIVHGGGIGTSYSHMSRMVVAPGSHVRQGQLIGFVGSTGLSTGPHLHYEVYRGGVAVDPLSVRFVSRAQLEGPALETFRARLRQLLAIGVKG